MKTIFDSTFVNYSEYSYVTELTPTEQIQYLFETYDASITRLTEGIDLSTVFEMIKDNLNITIDEPERYSEEHMDLVDVMIDDSCILLETNSLKALRHIIYKFAESGYILRRDHQAEKMFKGSSAKVTRYIRVFQIIDQIASICLN